MIRLGSNLVSFARLAAFGVTHAALGLLVWQTTTALVGRGWLGVAGAVVVFVIGNTVTFCLEALVTGVAGWLDGVLCHGESVVRPVGGPQLLPWQVQELFPGLRSR